MMGMELFCVPMAIRAMICVQVLGILLIGVVSAQIVGTETLISTDGSGLSQYSPVVFGEEIVWTDGNGYLHLYNLITGNESLIINNRYGFEAPALSGDYLVAQAFDVENFNYDIYLYEISTGTGFIITPNTVDSNEVAPSISGHYIGWKRNDVLNSSCGIYLYDIDRPHDSPQLIQEDLQPCLEPTSPPSLSGDYITWEAVVDGYYDIFLFDITSGDPLNNTVDITPETPESDQEYPSISGNYLVWQGIHDGYSDIYLYDINSGDPVNNTVNLTPDTLDSDQKAPSIDGNNITWLDTGTGGLYLYNIQDSTREEIIPASRKPANADLSDNKIVYEGDFPPDPSQIYLFTIGITVTCSVADFSNITEKSGTNVPFTVQFEDLSVPIPDVTIWDFGDGTPTSREANPEHTYENAGVYNVSLTVSTPYCRNAITKYNFVSVGQEPFINFTGTPTCGMMPLSVSFSDGSSGNPTEWAWDFDSDGVIDSTAKNPTYVYSAGGNYSVNLTAMNVIGSSSLLKPGYISVMNRSGSVVNTTIDGLSIVGSRIALNTTILPQYTLDGGILTFIPPSENGIKEINLIGDTNGFNGTGDLVEGNITGVFISSEQIPLDGMSDTIGRAAYLNFTLELPHYPVDGTIEPYVFEGAVPCDLNDLQAIVFGSGFSDLSRVAYEIRLQTSNMGTISNMTMNLSVNSTWVTDRSKMWVVRIGDDETGEVLPTQFLTEDSVQNMDVFTAYSPRGPSRFALSILSKAGNPLQIIVLSIKEHIDFFVGGSDDSGYYPVTTNPVPTSATPTTVPTEVPPETISPSEGYLPIDLEGSVFEEFEIEAGDDMGRLTIANGTRAVHANGTSVQEISMKPTSLEAIPSFDVQQYLWEGLAYQFQPEGATFEPPLLLTLTIPEDRWQSDRVYQILLVDSSGGAWKVVPATIHPGNRTITAEIGHFSVVALFSQIPPSPATTTSTLPSPAGKAQTPLSLFTVLIAIGMGMVVLLWLRKER